MVDHCPAEKLLEHCLEFTEKINLDLKLMFHIGMDGPSINLKFEDLFSFEIFTSHEKFGHNRSFHWDLISTHCS